MLKQLNKSALYIVFLASFQQVSAQTDSTLYFTVKNIVEESKNNYAPDGRIKILSLIESDLANKSFHIETTETEAAKFIENKLLHSGAQFKITLLPDASIADKPIGVINLSVANLRTKPSHAAELASQVLLGAKVDILQKNGGDYRIRTAEGYIAWVPTSSVVAMTLNEGNNYSNKNKVIFTREYGKATSEANTNSQRISDLVYGDILRAETEPITVDADHFYQVTYPDGRKGFIHTQDAVPLSEWLATRNPTETAILESAKTMMGLPYLWGGTSIKGVDCSGLTKTAYFMNGLIIPRDASQQVNYGDEIDILDAEGNFDPTTALQNLKPADLLFFAAGKSSGAKARVTHVALYLGNGEFIHAAGTVRINSMLKEAKNYDDFQTRTVVAARRYIGSNDPAIQKVANSIYYK